MAQCTVCGGNAGFMLVMCRSCSQVERRAQKAAIDDSHGKKRASNRASSGETHSASESQSEATAGPFPRGTGRQIGACPRCGRTIQDTHDFIWCTNCGKALPKEITNLLEAEKESRAKGAIEASPPTEQTKLEKRDDPATGELTRSATDARPTSAPNSELGVIAPTGPRAFCCKCHSAIDRDLTTPQELLRTNETICPRFCPKMRTMAPPQLPSQTQLPLPRLRQSNPDGKQFVLPNLRSPG